MTLYRILKMHEPRTGYANFDPLREDDNYEPTELMKERNVKAVSYTHLSGNDPWIVPGIHVHGCSILYFKSSQTDRGKWASYRSCLLYTSSASHSDGNGQIPEWPKGTDCKSAANCFGGSNPPDVYKRQSDISDELRQMVLDTAVEMGYSTKRSKKVENRKRCV